MPIYSLTKEKMTDLDSNLKKLKQEIQDLKAKTPE